MLVWFSKANIQELIAELKGVGDPRFTTVFRRSPYSGRTPLQSAFPGFAVREENAEREPIYAVSVSGPLKRVMAEFPSDKYRPASTFESNLFGAPSERDLERLRWSLIHRGAYHLMPVS